MNQQEYILVCPKCGIKNKIRPHLEKQKPVCGRCKTTLIEPFPHSHKKSSRLLRKVFNVFLLIALAGVSTAILFTPTILKKDYSDLVSDEREKTTEMHVEQKKHLTEVEARLKKEYEMIDAEKLRSEANQYYTSLYEARQSFERRYALTPREKTLLRMQELASDSTKTYHELIVSVTREASPKGSKIWVDESPFGIALHIDFNMDSMTAGEQGTRTKHHTKESLKREVISLISRVTNDAFLFCKELGLTTIHVGCLHDVRTTYQGSNNQVENMILYKMVIHKDRIVELSDNPFLDIYSTTEYLEVEEDNFSEIEIIRSEI